MRKYDKLMMLALGISVVLVIVVNIAVRYIGISDNSAGREYRVWINRISSDILEYEKVENEPPANVETLQNYFGVEEYKFIDEVRYVKLSNIRSNQGFVNAENKDYVIYATDDYVYKITYRVTQKSNIFIWANVDKCDV